MPKRLGLLSDLVPAARRLAVHINPRNSVGADFTLRDVQDAARRLKWPIDVYKAGTRDEIEAAFDEMDRDTADALFIAPDPYFNSRRYQLASLATRHEIAACYSDRDFVETGGLMSYGTDVAGIWRQVGAYTGRILSAPSTKFEAICIAVHQAAIGREVLDRHTTCRETLLEVLTDFLSSQLRKPVESSDCARLACGGTQP